VGVRAAPVGLLRARVAAVVLFGASCAGGTDAATGVQGATTSLGHESVSATPTLPTVPVTQVPAPSTNAPTPSSSLAITVATTAPPDSATTSTSTVAPPPAVAATTVDTTLAPVTAAPPDLAPPPTSGGNPWTVPRPSSGSPTSCRQVVHIGDSTSEHLWNATTVGGDPNATMDARYGAVGVIDVYNDTSGGRSMVERINRQQRNALEVAEEVRASGFHGCWVLMVGTNDAANVAAGANLGLEERIESMMAIIGGDPVLWVNAASSSSITWYGDDSMQAFNAALADAATRHGNLGVFDWAAVVQPDWYGPDGLHHTPTGRAWRTALTVQELAFAFPG
jgi:hypothetical protein